MLTLAGTLYTPFADAVLSECTVTFVALRTGDAVVQHSSASVTTDAAGNYSIDVLPGRYDIALDIDRRRRFLARNLEVADDTPADTINDLVTLAAQSEGLTDERVADYRALVADAKAARDTALAAAAELEDDGRVPVIANVALGGHRVIALDDTGQGVLASAANPAHAYAVVGISRAAALAGETLFLSRSGDLISHNGWSFTPFEPVFVGLDGQLTQAPPETGVYVLSVGTAIAADRILVSVSYPILIQE